jgi:hypothetical protein
MYFTLPRTDTRPTKEKNVTRIDFKKETLFPALMFSMGNHPHGGGKHHHRSRRRRKARELLQEFWGHVDRVGS